MTNPDLKSSVSGGTGLRVWWTRSAVRDLENAYEFVRFQDPRAARRLAASIQTAVRRLSDHPKSGPVARDLSPVGDYRHVVVAPYRVIYMVVDAQVIVILRVWDGRRDPASLSV